MEIKKQIASFLMVVAMVAGARAQIVLKNTSSSETTTKTWTVMDLNNDPNPTVSTGNAEATGTLTGAGEFAGTDEFSLTASARYGWNTASASGAVAGGTFSNYLAGLTAAGIGAINGAPFGVDSPSGTEVTAFDGTAEVMVLTAGTSGLSVGAALSLKGIAFQIYDNAARTDLLVYDASANSVIAAQWNTYFTGSFASGDWMLDDGDMVLIATGAGNSSTKWRVASVTLDATAGDPDTDPPTPNPASWASVPTNIGPVAISMMATTGSDASGVEYFFDETSGNPGGTDSGWQSEPSYTDSGLDPLTQYSYIVQMRDAAGNTGMVSSVAYATTAVPDTDPPTPNPVTWAAVPTNSGPFAIHMTATAGSDENGVEYFFDETSGNTGGTDSGWQGDPSYTNSGLFPGTQYSYTVMMRDTLGNSGTVSSVESATTSTVTGRTNGPPNVVIIYADDLGYADIGHNASPINHIVHTPNIDRICNEGIYLSNYMTHHVCSPSRSGLLTGRHYTEVGVGAQTGGTMDNSIPNIAKDFKAAGYATAAFGKWHNSSAPESDDGNWEVVPNLAGIDPYDGVLQLTSDETNFGEGVNAYGFDEWSGFYGGGHSYHDRINAREFDWWINNTWSPDVTGYNTYIIRDSALNFIDENATNAFFLYIPNEAVHGPYEILNTDLEEMCNIVDDENPSLVWSAVKEVVSPTSGRKVKDVLQLYCSGGDEFDKDALDVTLPGFSKLVYYTMSYAMDKSTGEILDRLDAYGLMTNTIVVFASDNGGTTSGDNYPLRGFKHQLYEGGVHVAAAIWWPGHLDANQAPYAPGDNVYTNLTQYFDWYPTLVNMAGQTVTATELDGINLYPNLLARTSARPEEYINSYYGVDDRWAAIRTQRWKLHFNRVPGTNQVLELYDLYNDIGETNNVQASYPAERDALIAMMDDWFSSGDVTGSYYPLMGVLIPPYQDPAPEGDILEVTATQTNSIVNLKNEGIYVRYSDPDWAPDVLPYNGYAHAGDIFQYDIYVAEDSDPVSGFFCSPSDGPTPSYDNTRGIHLDGTLLEEQTLPKGRWIRRLCGMGEVAPNSSYASFIALLNSSPGYYHFYIDNVVIRKNDGSIRGVTWSSAADWTTTRYWQGGSTYKNLADVPNRAFSDIALNVADLSTLPASTNAGSVYGSWAASVGGGIDGYDPAGPGLVNNWPIVMEYGLGSDPTTYTAGLLRGTNTPTSGELGTYTFRNLLVESQNKDYMTMTFDFNREASDIEIVVAESSNLVDWVDSVVLQPPYADTSILSTNELVVDVEDNLSGYPVDTTRVTARGSVALDGAPRGFLKLEVRPVVASPDTPSNLRASVHGGIVLEWSGNNENGEYIIERATSGSGTYTEISRTGSQLYTDLTAVAGQTYDYRVRAMNVTGASDWSNMATIRR